VQQESRRVRRAAVRTVTVTVTVEEVAFQALLPASSRSLMLTVAVTPHEALAAYLGLGGARSVRLLHRKLIGEVSNKAPSLRTLLNWSGRYGWTVAAAEYDREVGEGLLRKVKEAAISTGFDRAGSLLRVAHRCLDAALEMPLPLDGGTPHDLKALATTAINCLKTVELLCGGATERAEQRQSMAEEALALLRQLEQRRRGGEILALRKSSPPNGDAI
jgi:hypothetical protein